MPIRDLNEYESIIQRLIIWFEQHSNAKMDYQAKTLSFRRDIVTLLTFVRDNKVVGTQSTGNMPLKAVREVTERFVNPPKLEKSIGNRTYSLRSEIELWPLYFMHILNDVGGLLKTAPARRWKLTNTGKNFLDMPPLIQLSFLMTVWWHKVNWLVAYPYEGMGDALPPFFNLATLDSLLALSVETSTPFEGFADSLIEKTGLTWTAQNLSAATMFLRSSIARMVIQILSDFGTIELEYRDEPFGKGTTSKLDAFKITPFGKIMIEALAIARE